MFSMLRHLDTSTYTYRTYIVSSGDSFSAAKAKDFEARLSSTSPSPPPEAHSYEILVVPRARKIHQPLLTTPFTSLLCLLSTVLLLSPRRRRPHAVSTPDLILTNGPATGVLVIISHFILRVLGLAGEGQGRVIYVESWARVGSLSLSGRILEATGLTDRLLVQWEKGLEGASGRIEDIVEDGKVVGKRKGRREWRGFLVE
jgi:beta-1,4-N-acetylglucosaminyltransferase